MSIKNLQAYIDNLWDWGILDGCFGNTRIQVTDIDGLVERNGHFLMIEAKSPDKIVPKGQQILFDQLVKDARWHVVVVWGKPGQPEYVQVWGRKKVRGDLAYFQRVVARWFAYANSQNRAVPLDKSNRGAA